MPGPVTGGGGGGLVGIGGSVRARRSSTQTSSARGVTAGNMPGPVTGGGGGGLVGMGGSERARRSSIQASSPWAVEGDQGQIVVRINGRRSGKLTLRLRTRGAGDPNGQRTDGESPDGEEGESSFEEHDDTDVVRKSR